MNTTQNVEAGSPGILRSWEHLILNPKLNAGNVIIFATLISRIHVPGFWFHNFKHVNEFISPFPPTGCYWISRKPKSDARWCFVILHRTMDASGWAASGRQLPCFLNLNHLRQGAHKSCVHGMRWHVLSGVPLQLAPASMLDNPKPDKILFSMRDCLWT